MNARVSVCVCVDRSRLKGDRPHDSVLLPVCGCERHLVKILAASSTFKIITDGGEQLGLPAGVFGGSGEARPLDGTHEHSGVGRTDAYLGAH